MDEVTVMVGLLLFAFSLFVLLALGIDIQNMALQSVPSSWGIK
jgi:hypothetical protein